MLDSVVVVGFFYFVKTKKSPPRLKLTFFKTLIIPCDGSSPSNLMEPNIRNQLFVVPLKSLVVQFLKLWIFFLILKLKARDRFEIIYSIYTLLGLADALLKTFDTKK